MHMQVHTQIHRYRRLGGFCSTGCIDDCAGVVRPPLRAGLQCRAWSSAHDGSMGDMGWLDIAHVVFVTACMVELQLCMGSLKKWPCTQLAPSRDHRALGRRTLGVLVIVGS